MEADKQISDIATSLEAIKKLLESHTTSFTELKTWKADVDSRVHTVDTKIQAVDTKVTGLNTSIDDLRNQISRLELQRQEANPAYKVFDVEHFDLTNSGAAHLAQSSKEASSGQFGHGMDDIHRGFGCGVVTTVAPPPVTGAKPTSDCSAPSYHQGDIPVVLPFQSWGSLMSQRDFPQFDGRNPKIRQKKYESFFDLCGVPRDMWVKLATLHFVGTADF